MGRGGVSPTLNAFDNTGDSRATVVIAFSAGNSAKARSIAITEDATPPLRAGASGTNQVPTVLIIDGTRVNDVRVYDDEITPCLKSRMGTGGNNVPFVTQETTHDVIGTIQARSYKGPNHENARDGQLVIQETDMTDVNGSDIAATLRGFGHGWQGQHNSTNAVAQETTHDVIGTIQARSHKGPNHENARDGQLVTQETDMTDAIPIQDGRGMEKHQNGFGVGIEGDPSYTLDQTGGQSVAIPIQGTIIGRQDHNGPQGKGFGNPGDPSYTLDSVSQHGVATTMQVRRLTPIECERLMGWKDNHTLPRADGKTNSDTTRYKMCGNGVASPVAEWIGRQIIAATE